MDKLYASNAHCPVCPRCNTLVQYLKPPYTAGQRMKCPKCLQAIEITHTAVLYVSETVTEEEPCPQKHR